MYNDKERLTIGLVRALLNCEPRALDGDKKDLYAIHAQINCPKIDSDTRTRAVHKTLEIIYDATENAMPVGVDNKNSAAFIELRGSMQQIDKVKTLLEGYSQAHSPSRTIPNGAKKTPNGRIYSVDNNKVITPQFGGRQA